MAQPVSGTEQPRPGCDRPEVFLSGADRRQGMAFWVALQVLPQLEGEFDFVFIDALKRDYLKYLQALEPKLKPGAVVVADNVIQSAREMRDFLEYLQTSPQYETTIVRTSMDKNDGMAISYRLRRE